MPKITFLGTNGWYDTKTGNTISVLIETGNFYIVLDAGYGFSKISQYAKDDKPVYVFLSHFHLDHVIGLHTLDKNSFPEGLYFILQEGGTKILKTLLNFPYTAPIDKMPFKAEFIEVPENSGLLPFKAEFLPMVHTSFTLGIRIETEGKIIAFCPDTGYCENAVLLSRNADLVITECAYRCGEVNEGWPHLNPELSARIALEAGAKKLLLTHFDAEKYPEIESRYAAEKASREIFPQSYASVDGMELEV